MADNNNSTTQTNQPTPDLIPETDGAAQKPADTGDIKVRARKTPKPVVEGINSPVGGTAAAANPLPVAPVAELGMLENQGTSVVVPPKITLTSSEKKLIDEQSGGAAPITPPPAKTQIFPASITQKITLPQKTATFRKVGWSMLLSLLAVCLVFGVLLWYNGQGTHSGSNLFPQRPNVPIVTAPVPPPPVPTSLTATPPPATTTTPTMPAPTPPPVASITQVKVANTPTGYLNVRSTPATSGKLLTRVHPGEVYVYSQTQNGWYYISLPNGSQGWVTGQYVQVVK